MRIFAGQHSFEQRDFVLWTADGEHDLQTVQGTRAQCEDACRSESKCIGFSRAKVAAANQTSDCYLKTAAPLDSRYPNPDYEAFTKGASQICVHDHVV